MISTDAQVRKTGKNIGLLTKCQLKTKLDEATGRPNSRTTPKRNRNGKQGVGRANNYEYIPFSPRKKCYNCGNCNHLAIDCRKNKKKPKSIHRSDVAGKKMKFKQENSCLHCGSYWRSLNICFDYHDIYENYYDQLPKFYKHAGTNKTCVNKHVSCLNKSVTDKTDNSSACDAKKVYVVKNSQRVEWIQQVWILKTSN